MLRDKSTYDFTSYQSYMFMINYWIQLAEDCTLTKNKIANILRKTIKPTATNID